MATKAQIGTDLTLEIDGNKVTPERFLRVVRSFFAVLSEVTAKVAGKKGGVQWTVEVKQGSNLIEIKPEPGFNPVIVGKIVSAMSDGFIEIEDRVVHPRFFTERAIKSVRELAEVVGTSEDNDTTVRVWAKKTPISVTHRSVTNISELLASEHQDYGSIEGKLQTLSERGGLQFVVYEPLWDKPIRCYIPDTLVEVAMTNFRKRVEVHGLIKYRKDGRPLNIHVDDIVPFPAKEDIPSFRDVHGILREAS